MIEWMLKRVLQSLLVVAVMTVLVFIGTSVIGNPADILIPPDADQAERIRIVQQLGLDQPLWVQYYEFVKGLLRGDLGLSFVYAQSPLTIIWQKLPATLELAVSAMLISIVLGIPLGLYAGLRPRSASAKGLMAFSILGFSMPTFWIGIMMIMVFSVQLGWLPSSGRGETVELLGMQWSFLTLDGLRHLLLPAVNLAIFKTALILRLVRAGTAETVGQDHIRYARARGLSENWIVRAHVLKNIMIPVITIIGLEFGSVIAFSVVTENIFAWPGMGKLLIDSINVLDRPVVVAYLIVIVLIFVLINFVVDLVYTMLDPRVRLNSKGER